jgi:hypothetical protein
MLGSLIVPLHHLQSDASGTFAYVSCGLSDAIGHFRSLLCRLVLCSFLFSIFLILTWCSHDVIPPACVLMMAVVLKHGNGRSVPSFVLRAYYAN